MATGGGNTLQMDNICKLLDSADTALEIRAIILENLHSTKETWLIHVLVDYYLRNPSNNVQEILAELRDMQAKALMDKLFDGIKTSEHKQAALQLLLYLVYRELPWCHLILESPLFGFILKNLKTEIDSLNIMTSLMIVVILLPSVPVSMGPYLPTIFEIFGRLTLFCCKKPAIVSEAYILHIQVGLNSLFNRLYGMYPCTFVAFLNKFYCLREHSHAYEELVLPMLERVRLHPRLVMGQKETETSMSRWKNHETQDIVVYCSKLSLDLIEGSWEGSHMPVFQSMQSAHKLHLLNHQSCEPQGERQYTTPTLIKPIQDPQDSVNSLHVTSLDPSCFGESPSVLIGLSTPPSSQRTTPAASFLDPVTNTGGASDTPEMTPRLQTPSQCEDGEKTPQSCSGSKGAFQHVRSSSDSKKPAVVVPKVLSSVPHQTTPVTPGSYMINSPGTPNDSSSFSSRTSAFLPPPQSNSPAMRILHFNQTDDESDKNELKEERPNLPKTGDTTRSLSKIQQHKPKGEVVTLALPVEYLPQVINSLPTPDSDTLDLEVAEITEKDDRFDDKSSPSSSVSTLTSQTDVTAESVRQFMKKVNRIRFNSLTSNSSSDFDAPPPTLGVPHYRACRPRSCPPLKRQNLQPLLSAAEKHGVKGSKKQASAGVHCISKCLGRQISMIEGAELHNGGDDFSQALSGHSTDHRLQESTKQEGGIVVASGPLYINPVFQYMLAPSKLAICSSCHQQLVVTPNQALFWEGTTLTTYKGNEVPVFSMMSPPELLDRHLQLGSDIHNKELTKLPLTCKETTNWTHFGGNPPVDEVNILRTQGMLLQNQLMYERHKCTNHAKRNRRLLRKITNVAMLEEQQKTLLDQVRLYEESMQHLNVSVKLLQEENRRLKQSQESDEYEKLVQFRTSLKENKDLKASSVVLKNLLLTQKEDYDKQQKKLESVQNKNLEYEKELEICRERLANTEQLKQKVFQLQKEVLLMQEFHQKCQEKLHHSRTTSANKIEESYLINALKVEIAALTKENKKKSNLLEAYHTRTIELDEFVKTKEIALNEMKKNFELAKSCHDEKLKAVEERCKSMAHIIQQLESKVLELTGSLDKAKHKQMLEARLATSKANSSGGGAKSRSGKGQEAVQEHSSVPLISATQLLESKIAFSKTSSDIPVSRNDVGKSEEFSQVASVVVANKDISLASSNFSDSNLTLGDLQPFLSSRFGDDVFCDSGAASKSSFRVESDVSIKSISDNSLTTGDSGI